MNDNALCNSCGLLPQFPVQPKPAPVCKQKKKCCPKKDCCGTEFAFRKVLIPAALGDDITGEAKPELGAYTNSYVYYEANAQQYLYDSYGVYTKLRDNTYTFSDTQGGWKVVDSNGISFSHEDSGGALVLRPKNAELPPLGETSAMTIKQFERWDDPITPVTAVDILVGKSLVADGAGKVALVAEREGSSYIVYTLTYWDEKATPLTLLSNKTLGNETTTVPYEDIPGLTEADVVINGTTIYDADGCYGVVVGADANGVTIKTIVKASASGGGELQTGINVSNPLGRYAMGDMIPAGTSFETIFRGLLTNVYYPTLTNPSASLTYNMPTYMEVGDTISARAATLTLNRGSINPQYTAASSYRSGAATNYALVTSGADTEYSDSSASSGSFSVNALTRSTKGSITLTGTVSYAEGVQPKDSDGNNYDSPLPAGSVAASKTVQFILPFYYGKSASGTVSDFTGLAKDLTPKVQKKYKFTTNNEHMVVAYDSSYGNLTSIIDPNGFEVIGGWSKTSLTVGGFTYFVWTADLATTDTDAEFTFKF